MATNGVSNPCGALLDPTDVEFSLNPNCGIAGPHQLHDCYGIQWPVEPVTDAERLAQLRKSRDARRAFVQLMHRLDVPMRRGIFLADNCMVKIEPNRYAQFEDLGLLPRHVATKMGEWIYICYSTFEGMVDNHHARRVPA